MPRLNQPKKLGKMIQTVNVPKSDNFSQVWAFLNTDQDRKKKKKFKHSDHFMQIQCKSLVDLSKNPKIGEKDPKRLNIPRIEDWS